MKLYHLKWFQCETLMPETYAQASLIKVRERTLGAIYAMLGDQREPARLELARFTCRPQLCSTIEIQGHCIHTHDEE